MRYPFSRLLACIAAGTLTAACAGCFRSGAGTAPPGTAAERPAVVLVSLDGFRWDYVHRGITPNLDRIAEGGVRADGLIPSFPSKTFPNHYTLVTGLYPDNHGIVANTLYDPEFDDRFSMYHRETVRDGRWWGGEPVWVTAEARGLTTAPGVWPGSEAAIGGLRPQHWMAYDGAIPYDSRVDGVLSLLDLPAEERPVFLTLYFSSPDAAGHVSDPDSEAVNPAIAEVDAAVGRLLDGLDGRRMWDVVNVIVVSDHGMTPIQRDRVIFLDDYLDISAVEVVDWNPVLAVWPEPADVDRVYAALSGAHPHLQVYRKDEFPARLHYGRHRRVAPVTGLADPGWSIATHDRFDERPDRYDGGNHGYDPASRDMQGVFMARGPAFRERMRVDAFSNVHVYPLIMKILALPAASSDGSLEAVEAMLVR